MTRDEARQLLPIIQAYSEGKTVQRATESAGWVVDTDPTFIGPYFRIKPEPIECWAVVRGDGKVIGAFDSLAQADSYRIGGRVIRMREVHE